MAVQLAIEGAVATITLNRPEKRNALTVEMREALIAHLQQVRFDDAVRVVVLAGAGPAFCTGADVDRMGQTDLLAARQRLQRLSHTYMRTLHAIEKPVIAAVRGHAVGVGWSPCSAATSWWPAIPRNSRKFSAASASPPTAAPSGSSPAASA